MIVDGEEKFSGGGDEGDFGRFTSVTQAFVKVLESTLGTDGTQGSHVKGAADAGSATTDMALAFARAAVVVEGSQACESGDLAT